MAELYIGLMSGTSADGIDAALVDSGQPQPMVIATHYTPYTAEFREKILALYHPGDNEIQRLGEMDVLLGRALAQAAQKLLKKQELSPADIQAIGSHGHNIRHHPYPPHHFTLQIGDPNIIAAETGITTIADFRRKDVALGGQGAPLVPAFHQQIFAADTVNRAIVNIGGIANVTLLPGKNNNGKNSPVIGFDTGPGNALMNEWVTHHQKTTHDDQGAWAAQGRVHHELLESFLADPYFQKTAPKSTGREYFNLAWLNKHLAAIVVSPVDVQATLAELTAHTIIAAISSHLHQDESLATENEILICGGGVHNNYLMARLQALARPKFTVSSTKKYDINPDWIEAMAFAWLAKQTLNQLPGNVPSVTGAKQAVLLGGIYYPY